MIQKSGNCLFWHNSTFFCLVVKLTASLAMPLVYCALALPRFVMAQEIWFMPESPYEAKGLRRGPADWDRLFDENDDNWGGLTTKVNAFIVNTQFMSQSDPGVLKRVASWLQKHGIALGTEMLSQEKPLGCGDGVEGYAPGNIQDNKKKFSVGEPGLRYLNLDEPLWFGHYYNEKNACHTSIPEIAQRVAVNVRPYVEYFKSEIVDVEPASSLHRMPNWKSDYVLWIDSLQHEIGKKLYGVILDLDWEEGNVEAVVQEFAQLAKQKGLKLGVIYNGSPRALTSFAWNLAAETNYLKIERSGFVPDIAVFETWDSFPKNLFPATDRSAHLNLVARYFRTRSVVQASRHERNIEVRLIGDSGLPITKKKIEVEMVGSDPDREVPALELSGIVPGSAKKAIAAVRLNTEGNCRGRNEIFVSGYAYTEGDGVHVHADDIEDVPGEDYAPVTYIRSAHKPVRRLVTSAQETIRLNGKPFNVQAGRNFSFSMGLFPSLGHDLNGSAVLIFLDESGAEVQRVQTKECEVYLKVAEGVTDEKGKVTLLLPKQSEISEAPIKVIYRGDDKTRASSALIK